MKRPLMIMAMVALIPAMALGSAAAAQESTIWRFASQPVDSLFGWADHLSGPSAIAFDDSGLMYVANTGNNSIAVYAADWKRGNSEPVKILQGPSTQLNRPVALAFDADQNMYVVNNAANSITVYSAEWVSGDTAPTKTLAGTGTQIAGPRGIAFDSIGRMYVTNTLALNDIFRGSVTVYDDGWASGATAPVLVLSGASAGLLQPQGITFDEAGYMYVANAFGITAYEPGWDAGSEPVRVLAGPGTGLDGARNIALDDIGRMYVTNGGGGLVGVPHLTVYAPNWASGNTPPIGVILAPRTLLTDPAGVTLGESGRLYVTSAASDGLGVYQTQTITAEPADSVPWTTTTVTITAEATSGLPATITTTAPAICSGNGTSPLTVTVKAVGTCTYEVSQAGNADWLPALEVSEAFSISTAPQTITATTPSDTSLRKKWIRLKASTTSDLPVIWTSSTPDVCVPRKGFGQRLNLVAVGTCTLTASQPGNRLWSPADSVSVSFDVTK